MVLLVLFSSMVWSVEALLVRANCIKHNYHETILAKCCEIHLCSHKIQ
jgi:hypothetical protein